MPRADDMIPLADVGEDEGGRKRARTGSVFGKKDAPAERNVFPNHVGSTEFPNAEHGWMKNNIRTTKYTLLTFLPRNLFEQFHRLANVYFLFIACLNWVPAVQAFGKEISFIPLLFVLAVTALKDAYEDRRRARSDREVNNSTAEVLRHGKWTKQPWAKVQVGDLIRVLQNEAIPADMVLLHASSHEDKTGFCYIETANLDGETNLKQRQMYTEWTPEFDPTAFSHSVTCEAPNVKIYQFNGQAVVNPTTRLPLDKENFLLRGCVVRNTKAVVGIVTYAGHDTKAMMNNTGPRSKISLLERTMNREVLWCLVILIVMCAIGGIVTSAWMNSLDYKDVLFYPYAEGDPSSTLEGFIRFWTFFIIFQVMVPISLYVSIEFVKIAQVFFLQNDIDLYDEDSNKTIWCRALNITEDLGQIEYIFSDKTGTLTQNKMVFHACSVAGKLYGHEEKEDGRTFQDAYTFPRDSTMLAELEADPGEVGAGASPLHNFLLSLAISNTVAPDDAKLERAADGGVVPGSVIFEAESPDEQALVSCAHTYGYALTMRNANACTVSHRGKETTYTVLAILPFDNDRKRMTVIVRLPDGTIRMMCKGADSAVYDVLREDPATDPVKEATLGHIDAFARRGLRTLCFAYKDLSPAAWERWSGEYATASKAMQGRKAKKLKLMLEMETELELLGCTGVEDKLQDGVPQAIETLRMAGIKIWVLTGDKQETAVQIAHSCQLMTPQMNTVLLNCESAALHGSKPKTAKNRTFHKAAERDTLAIIERELARMEEMAAPQGNGGPPKESALVVDGATLSYCLLKENKLRFLDLAVQCKVVVACRSTPLQKAQVVQLVKENKRIMSLAIGDGANDVSMIQMAHVGIGISGMEGMQAVMASDFAIPQFRYLEKLLIVHGHWSYYRIADMIHYFFYKNAAFVFLLFWFQLSSKFSGQNAVEQLYLFSYNLVWTAFPIMVTATFNQDAPASMLMSNPWLYEVGMKNLTYRNRFWWEMLDALWQSAVLNYVPVLAVHGNDVSLLELGNIQIFCCVLVATLHVGLVTLNWNGIHWFFNIASVVLLFGFALIYNSLLINLKPEPYFTAQEIMSTGVFWWCFLVSVPLALGPRFIWYMCKDYFRPSGAVYAREQSLLAERKRPCCSPCHSALDGCFPSEPVSHGSEPVLKPRRSSAA